MARLERRALLQGGLAAALALAARVERGAAAGRPTVTVYKSPG